MIANAIDKAYSGVAPIHLGVGIDLPRKSTNRCSLEAPFFAPVVFGRLYGGAIFARRSLAGKVNSVQSAILIDLNDGSSLNQQEDRAMSNDPARHELVEKGRRLFSQLSHEKQFICLSILKNPKLLEILDKLPRDHVVVIQDHMCGLIPKPMSDEDVSRFAERMRKLEAGGASHV